jgi:hypothetical protein
MSYFGLYFRSESVTPNEILTLIAVIAGPVSAVLITRYLDDQRLYKARRMDVFRTLMRTRRTVLSPEHIGALNLVEIEFAKDRDVIAASKNLLTHFGTTHARRDDERIETLADQNEIRARNNAFGTRLLKDRQSLLTKLLHAMSRSLGFKIEQLDIFEGGYNPQFWADVENEQEIVRKFAVDLAAGKAVIPIGVTDYRSAETVMAEGQRVANVAAARAHAQQPNDTPVP